jgi:hypothetical protein
MLSNKQGLPLFVIFQWEKSTSAAAVLTLTPWAELQQQKVIV